MIQKINKAYIRRYCDNGQVAACVEWTDGRGKHGRTEGKPKNPHMAALLARAEREGVPVELQTWGLTP